MEIKDLADVLQANTAEIKSAQEKLDAEIKANGEATAETKTALEEAQKTNAELKTAFDEMDKKLINLEVEAKRARKLEAREAKTAGDLFIASEVGQELKSASRGNGIAAEISRKDITGGAASAGALINPYRDPEVYRDPNRPTRVRDLFTTVNTPTGTVEYMRQNVFTNNAAPQSAEFAAKAQSEITWELITKSASTIAHWVAASRQVLSDAPQLKSLIDVDLAYGLDLESDKQLLLGTGTGGDMEGLLVDGDVPTVGQIASGTAAADVPAAMIDHIRAAVTTCQSNEYYNQNGIILNPVDWATLETAKATDGHYLMIQFPANGAENRIWKMPVVVTNAMPADNFILGDFMMGGKIYDKESVEIRVAEQHSDFFVKNGVAVLAEERYVLGIQRPKAFCKGLFTVAP